MAKILHLPVNPPAKLGYKRVKKSRKKNPEQRGQMNLFRPATEHAARTVNLPSKLSPFEEALFWDERSDSKASKLYAEAIAAGDCISDAYCNLGVLESKSGRNDEAFDCFTKSLKEDPRHLESHYNLANLYFDVGDLRLAKEHYGIAAKIDPDFPNVYFNLGLVLAMGEDYESAISSLKRYLDLAAPRDSRNVDDLLDSLGSSVSPE